MTVPQRHITPKPAKPKPIPTDIFGLHKAAQESGAPDAIGMVRSLAEAEHSLGIARQQRAMSDHLKARKSAKGK